MNIDIFHLLEGADQAGGLAVVIDVFRVLTMAILRPRQNVSIFRAKY